MGNKKSKQVEIRELTENEIQSILENTDYTREQITQLYDNFIKLYPSGFLFKDQFCKLYKDLYPNKQSDKYLEQIFKIFDSDKNGIVTFGEFVITVFLQGRKEPEEKLRLVFRMYDHNRNGFVDKKEIEAILKSIAENCEEITYEELMDWDKDESGMLNEDEFIKFTMDKPKLKKFYLDLIKVHD
ncbi:unnamed protein product [Brachionus calyciflorus]|uniref:EF-hand domain-containing protein n=1 Tax=Brachionus calyciflorus TaxID=104777 RepID=A0A813M475_9BILA|nr:unnamed protein product [Brachionus calyciflorus]